ncbi:hypothetical protein SBF1_7960001 [Candidatus Desulfosporosinus infrequens]|uniref:Uncharacterized protein n=1 Tax=Candidatus Desulfosporosinus infrequens TaxID=2043169 RepID=A0A2U3LS84_9FIRM|nr:hypothetical protein SBF1_7960001 [Candidatus Desulfosporosinus infrequens]
MWYAEEQHASAYICTEEKGNLFTQSFSTNAEKLPLIYLSILRCVYLWFVRDLTVLWTGLALLDVRLVDV